MNANERKFIEELNANPKRSVKGMKRLILRYKVPNQSIIHEINFEICLRHDIFGDKKFRSPKVFIYHSSNCALWSDEGESDKSMHVFRKKCLRTNYVVRFSIKPTNNDVCCVGFFGDIEYIDYLSLLDHITVESEYIGNLERLESLIVSPNCFIEKFNMSDISDTIRFMKLDGDIHKAKDGNIERLVRCTQLRSLYLIGAGYTGNVVGLLTCNNLKNATIIAPNVEGIEGISQEDYPNTILFETGQYWISMMR